MTKKLRTYSDIQLLNPLAKPDWRSRRVNMILKKEKKSGRPRASVADDTWTRGLTEFTRKWKIKGRDRGNVRERLYQSDPDLWIAHALWHESILNSTVTVALQARLLAGQSFEEIGEECGASPRAVEWYERCWFSVRDRLKQHDWVMNQIIIPSYQRSHEIIVDGQHSHYVGVARPFINAGIRLLSYRGGPAVADYLLNGGSKAIEDIPVGKEKAKRFIIEHAINTITRRAAIAAEEVILHADNITEMFNVFARILEVQRNADAQGSGGSGDSRIITAMHEVVEHTAQQWFSPSLDPLGIAAESTYRYDGDSDELRSGELATVALGHELHAVEGMPAREPKPALRPDQLRDRMEGAVRASMFPDGIEGVESEAN